MKSLKFAFILIAFLASCSPKDKPLAVTTSIPSDSPIPILTKIPTPFATKTAYKYAIQTEEPDKSSKHLNEPTSTITPTKTPFPTITPMIWGECPKEDPNLTPNLEGALSANYFDYTDIEEPVLINLNKGVTRKAIIDAFKKDDYEYNNRHYLEKDLTGDNIPELVIAYGPLYVFGCQQGAYKTMLAIQTDRANLSSVDPWIETVRDLNANGTPELVVTQIIVPFTWVMIYEWDVWQFQSLIEKGDSHLTDNVAEMKNAEVSFRQADNWTFELILHGGIPSHFSLYYDGYPWRIETKIYKWNGEKFALYRREFDAPDFRFQAVQDGDRASLVGEYDKALAYYQDAIFNDKLDWWTQRRKNYEFACWASGSSYCPTPTPPVPTPDPYEYPNLSGYARFRIMLLHAVRGFLPESQTVYDTIQEKYPKGQIGNAYAEMATAFWQEYQTSRNIEKACSSAIEYAYQHQKNILVYLGNGINAVAYFGDQSLEYQPEDICPFK